MTDRPIIFSAPMIRALLDGRKTQTRRALKDQPPAYCVTACIASNGAGWSAFDSMGDGFAISVPYEVGDRLWVREAFCINPAVRHVDRRKNVIFRAEVPDHEPPIGDALTLERIEWVRAQGLKWKPSIHMPRWASRLTLTVTDVRVQRLQDISEADAVAEGVEAWLGYHDEDVFQNYGAGLDFSGYGAAKNSFYTLWNSLYGPDAWDANPWVAAVTFTVHKCNIDKESTDG